MIVALLALTLSVVLGTIAHELAHATALRAFDVPHTVRWLPDRGPSGSLRMGVRGRWAMVSYDTVPIDLAPWKLRVAAVMPLILTVPVIVGSVKAGGAVALENDLVLGLTTVGWLACAIPSPADFAIFWHPEQTIAAVGER